MTKIIQYRFNLLFLVQNGVYSPKHGFVKNTIYIFIHIDVKCDLDFGWIYEGFGFKWIKRKSGQHEFQSKTKQQFRWSSVDKNFNSFNKTYLSYSLKV